MANEITEFGFTFGALEVSRINEWRGRAIIKLLSPKAELDVYVTPTGKVRIWNKKTDKEVDLNGEVQNG